MGYTIYLGGPLEVKFEKPYKKTVGKKKKCNPCQADEHTLVKLITTPKIQN